MYIHPYIHTGGFNYDLQVCNSQICLSSPDISPKRPSFSYPDKYWDHKFNMSKT